RKDQVTFSRRNEPCLKTEILGSSCFLPSESQTNNYKADTTPRKPIAVLIIKCLRMSFTCRWQWNFNGQEALSVNAAAVVKYLLPSSLGIDPAGDSGIGASDKWHAVFDSAECRGRGLLPLCRAFAEPSVVRDIHQKIRVRLNTFTG